VFLVGQLRVGMDVAAQLHHVRRDRVHAGQHVFTLGRNAGGRFERGTGFDDLWHVRAILAAPRPAPDRPPVNQRAGVTTSNGARRRSSAGLRSKKLDGRNSKLIFFIDITGQSSACVTW
jgi:hypothetical protein